jgi:hypothetical protein
MTEHVRFKTDEELAVEEVHRTADQALVKQSINELLGLLNPDGANYATSLTIVTPDGPKEFNVSPIFSAIAAQFQHFFNGTYNQHDVRRPPAETFFPHADPAQEGEELVKRQYFFDCRKRHVHMVLTFATVWMSKEGPTTVGQPRYVREYLFLGPVDNYEWRAVVNWVTAQFDRSKYVHLYGHNFEYVWEKDEAPDMPSTIRLIPAQTEAEPFPLCTIGINTPKRKWERWEPSAELVDAIASDTAAMYQKDRELLAKESPET